MRFAIFALTLLLAAATVTTVHAQAPTGSISGRLIFEGPQPDYDEISPNIDFFFFVIPANIPQPISLGDQVTLQHFAVAEADGTFIVDGLSDGDYYLFPIEELASGIPSPVTIAVVGGVGDDPFSRLAVRVAVSDGGATTGVELRVRLPEPTPTPTPSSFGGGSPLSPPNGPSVPRDCAQLSPPNGLSPVAIICPPATGAGGTTTSAGGAALAYAGLGVAGLAVAMFAGGLALRARRKVA